MDNIVSNIVVPLACAAAFCGAGVLGISAGSNHANEAIAANEYLKEDKVETVQHSFPVFFENERIGHCVLGIRTPVKKAKKPYTDPRRVTEREAIYDKASELLANASDGNAVCAELFAQAGSLADVEEFVYLVE